MSTILIKLDYVQSGEKNEINKFTIKYRNSDIIIRE